MGKYLGQSPAYGVYEKQLIIPDGVNNEFTLIYQAGSATSIQVVYGGIVQEPEQDYSLTNGGKKIVFAFVPQVGFRLYVIFLGREISVPAAIGNFPHYHTEIGDGVQTQFNLPLSPLTPAALIVFQNKILSRYQEEWTIMGNVVTFLTPPAVNDKLDFYIIGIERTDLVTVDPLAITNDKIGPMAVTADKLNLLYTPYVPILDCFGGMNINSQTIHSAEWMDTGRCIKLRLHFTVQVSGGDNKIRFSIPVNNNGSTNVSGNVTLTTATSLENGIIRWGAEDALDVYRQFGVNYTDDEWTAEINMEYESA